ncbi:hypothetical protein A5627_05725 [Mycobacterium colombiense]|nr:hypothetical protein A5627_05725 [Mycobacterium colombiense]
MGPNISDRSNAPSMRIAADIYETIDIPKTKAAEDLDDDDGDGDKDEDSSEPGAVLEKALKTDLESALPAKDPDRTWLVDRHLPVTGFAQFLHLSEIQAVLDHNPTLRSTFGGDYQIETDVCIGVENSADKSAAPFLHAAISSKWTIRSDRVQNVRHEFATLVRNRRGRSPHLIAVTAEPLPTRLLSIARGTGEVDNVYHLLYEQLEMAVQRLWDQLSREQRSAWTEMTQQKRLRPYSSLVNDLTLS